MIRADAEVVVLGAGFSGSLLAAVLARLGRSVVLLERGQHPRFSLGESSTPLANLILEQLGERYGLPALVPLAKYGRWKKVYPDLVCGLKRGFTFARHHPGCAFAVRADHAEELLVAASPADEVGDTHWLRADIDHFLARQAEAAGAGYFDRVELTRLDPGPPWRLQGTRDSSPFMVTTPFLIDATGPVGAVAQALGIESSPRGIRTNSWSVYTHLVDVERWEEVQQELGGRTDEHPYRCDDAALHHILDEGWVWVLRFDNGVTSAGVLVDGAKRQPHPDLSPEEEWQTIIGRYPSLVRQFRRARAVRPWVRTGRLQRLARRVAGPTWALVAPAAYTLDALFSTGNAHALCTVERLARAFEKPGIPDLHSYDLQLLDEFAYLDTLVHGCYRTLRHFPILAAWTMYYFAGAITAEERRRAGRATAQDGFLSCHRAELRQAVDAAYHVLGELAEQDEPDVRAFVERVAADIAPFNTVGLCDPARRNLYPYT